MGINHRKILRYCYEQQKGNMKFKMDKGKKILFNYDDANPLIRKWVSFHTQEKNATVIPKDIFSLAAVECFFF